MKYILKGNLRGFYCGDCFDYLYKAKVKVYAVDRQANVTALAVAREKETFHQRSEEELKALSKRLLFETETDEAGNFSIELGEKQNYEGGAFDIDFECGNVPIRFKPKRPVSRGPFQFHITTLQPMWKGSNSPTHVEAMQAYWEYGITRQYWCRVLSRFGVYVICGKVTDCETKIPLKGLVVKAYDVDLIQDDYLGSGTTGSDGHFKIYYTEADFSKTIFPWLNVEWPAGPDVYFSIETGSGTVVLSEGRNRGHQKDRENIPNCFCIDFCIRRGEGPDQEYAPVLFTHVGNYQIGSGFDANGFTNDLERNAFTGIIPLRGAMPTPFSDNPLEYRFLIRNLDTNVTVVADANYIVDTVIGSWDRYNVSPPPFSFTEDYHLNNAGAPHHVSTGPDGWITVPRENSYFGALGLFSPNNTLAMLDTTKLAYESFDLNTPGVYQAGSPFPATKKAKVHYFEITCEVRDVGSSSVAYSNTLPRIAVCNTAYQLTRHPSWAGGLASMYAPVMLELQETTLSGSGCGKIESQVTAHYTIVHPLIEQFSVSFEGNAPLPGTYSVNPVAAPANEVVGSHAFNTSAMQPCAYIIWLSATFRLTSGYGRIVSATITDHIAFCKATAAVTP